MASGKGKRGRGQRGNHSNRARQTSARGTQARQTPPRRTESRRPAPRRPVQRPAEELMFFPRLRRQAKWVFALLAAAFALGFVVFGVGSDVPGGISDLFGGRTAATGPSVSELLERVEDSPEDAEAWQELSQAYLQEGERLQALEALERYLELRPRDESALAQKASLHLTEAQDAFQEMEIIEAAAPQAGLPAGLSLPGTLGQVVGPNPFEATTQQALESRVAPVRERYTAQLNRALESYQRLVALEPENPTYHLQLAQIAEQAAQYQTALSSYRRFLELSPDDPFADQVQERVEALEQFLAETGQTSAPVSP